MSMYAKQQLQAFFGHVGVNTEKSIYQPGALRKVNFTFMCVYNSVLFSIRERL